MFLHHQEAESAFPPSSPGAAPGPGPAPRRLLPQRPRPRPSAAPPPPPDRPSACPPADVSRCVAERKYTQEQARKELQQVFIPECNEDGTYSQVCPPRPGARPPARRGEARRAAGPGSGRRLRGNPAFPPTAGPRPPAQTAWPLPWPRRCRHGRAVRPPRSPSLFALPWGPVDSFLWEQTGPRHAPTRAPSSAWLMGDSRLLGANFPKDQGLGSRAEGGEE